LSDAYQHLKDVPLVHEFWWSMYGFGAMSLRKIPIVAISGVLLLLAIHVSMSLARWQHTYFEPMFQESPDPLLAI